MVIHNPILTGSFTVNNIDVSSITSSAANITALNATTASLNSFSASVLSYTASQNILNGTYTLTSSFAAQTASFTAFSASVNSFSASILAQTASLNSFSASVLAQTASLNSFSASVLTFTGSASTRLGALEAATASLYTATSSLNASVASLNSYTQSTDAKIASIYSTTSSLNTRVGTLEAYTSSLNNKTSSFATTGSNNFIGTQTISGSVLQSGSFTSTGTLTAQTLVVQTITSSVVYSSGSNIFGNTIGNTQTFTGSVLITGSLTISTGGNVSAPTIFGSTIACSPIGCFATSCATSFIGGTISGTTIYGSTAVCGGTISGTTIFGSTAVCSTSGIFERNAATNATTLIVRQTTAGGNGDQDIGLLVDIQGANDGDRIANFRYYDGANYNSKFKIIRNGNGCFAGTITGTTIYGSTAVCSPVGLFSGCVGIGTTSPYNKLTVACCNNSITDNIVMSVRNDSSCAGTWNKIGFLGTTTGGDQYFGKIGFYQECHVYPYNYSSFTIETLNNLSGGLSERLRIDRNGIACFACQICAPSFVGGTMSGTTIYGSTAVCSAVGYFSGCVGIGFTGYGGSKLTLVASTNPTCASSANMQLSIGESSQNTTYSFKLGYIYVGGGYVGAIQTIAGGTASITVINPDGGNVGIGTSGPYQNLTVLKNQNADTAAGIYNQTDGTASSTTLRLDNGSYNGQLNLYANLYTASGTAVANTLRLYTDGPGGMSFSATNQHMRFYTSPNECLRMTILYGGSVGMGNANPKHNLDICSVTTNAGGLAFCNMVTAQCVWSTFACVGTDSNIVTTITYTNTIDYNRSGVFVARWAYNDTCAALYIRSCLWNDSQNIGSFGLRNNGGALQICLSGGGDSYRVQVLIQGSKAS